MSAAAIYRTETLTVRLTPDELRALRARADADDRPLSSYARHVLLRAREPDPLDVYRRPARPVVQLLDGVQLASSLDPPARHSGPDPKPSQEREYR